MEFTTSNPFPHTAMCSRRLPMSIGLPTSSSPTMTAVPMRDASRSRRCHARSGTGMNDGPKGPGLHLCCACARCLPSSRETICCSTVGIEPETRKSSHSIVPRPRRHSRFSRTPIPKQPDGPWSTRSRSSSTPTWWGWQLPSPQCCRSSKQNMCVLLVRKFPKPFCSPDPALKFHPPDDCSRMECTAVAVPGHPPGMLTRLEFKPNRS